MATRLIISPSFSAAGQTEVTYLELEDILHRVEFLLISAIDLLETTIIVPIASTKHMRVAMERWIVQEQLHPYARIHFFLPSRSSLGRRPKLNG